MGGEGVGWGESEVDGKWWVKEKCDVERRVKKDFSTQ